MTDRVHHMLSRTLILLSLLGMAAPSLFGQAPPPNDDCETAQVIPGAGPFPAWTTIVDITSASTSADLSPSCLPDSASRSVWYQFTPADSGPYLFSACEDAPTATTVEDTVLAVFGSAGGCEGPFVEVEGGCNDDSCGPFGFQSSLVVELVAGTTYYIVVWQYDNVPPEPGAGALQLLVKPFVVPDNDDCSGAIEVFLNRPVEGSTIGSANDYQVANFACYTGVGQQGSIADGGDVVYRFIAPTEGLYSVKAFDYSDLSDLVLYVGTDCPDGPAPANVLSCIGAANRNPVSTAEEVTCLPLSAGQEVFIFVDEDGQSSGSTFMLGVTRCVAETEPNDDPATAQLAASGLTGGLTSFGDVDMFSLGVPPVGSRVFAMLDAEAANLTDFDLRVTSETDTIEYDNDDNDTAFGDSAPNISGTPLGGDPAFLRITFNGFVNVEPYRLYALVQPALEEATQEVEPNGMLLDAQSAGNNYFYGSLAGPSPSLDEDFYRFSAAAGDLIYLALDADPTRDATPVNARLELLDHAGETLLSVNDVNDFSTTDQTYGALTAFVPNSPSEAIAYRTPAGGTFHAKVAVDRNSSGDVASGDYLLSISLNCFTGSGGTNRPPMPVDLASVGPVVRGEPATVTGRAFDPDLHQLQKVFLDWGDGSPVTQLTNVGTGVTFAADHLYATEPPGPDGSSYTVTVVAEDPEGLRGTNQTEVVVLRVKPARFLSVEYTASDTVVMNLSGSPSETYEIWSSIDFDTWIRVATEVAGPDGSFTVTDGGASEFTQRFYRAVSP